MPQSSSNQHPAPIPLGISARGSMITKPSMANSVQPDNVSIKNVTNVIPRSKIKSKEDAIDVVEDIVAGRASKFELVSAESMRSFHKLRSDYYNGFHFLCHMNSKRHAGWLLCNFVLSNHCSIKSGLKKFDTDTGTSTLRNHMKSHDPSSRKIVESKEAKLGGVIKKEIIDGAVHAVVQGIVPFSFCRKPGMTKLAAALIKAGQSVPVDSYVDVEDALPSATAVREGVKRLASHARDRLLNLEMEELCALRGGVTSDGLKQKVQGKKYYDFTAHFFRFGKRDILTGAQDIKLCKQVIFLRHHTGPESAEALRAMFDQALMEKCNIQLEDFMKIFTFVTDCASTMPCIVGASSSSRRVPYCEKWLGCISHQLNTAMKHVMLQEAQKNPSTPLIWRT